MSRWERRTTDQSQITDRTKEGNKNHRYRPHGIREGLRPLTPEEIQLLKLQKSGNPFLQPQKKLPHLYQGDTNQTTDDRINEDKGKSSRRYEPYTIRRGLRPLTDPEKAEVRSLQEQDKENKKNYDTYEIQKRKPLENLIDNQYDDIQTERVIQAKTEYYYQESNENYDHLKVTTNQDEKTERRALVVSADQENNETYGHSEVIANKSEKTDRQALCDITDQENKKNYDPHEGTANTKENADRKPLGDITDQDKNQRELKPEGQR